MLDWVKTHHKLVVLILWSGTTNALQKNEIVYLKESQLNIEQWKT